MSRTIEKALQERNETFVAAFNKGDIEAMAASYATDCDFLSADGQRVKVSKSRWDEGDTSTMKP